MVHAAITQTHANEAMRKGGSRDMITPVCLLVTAKDTVNVLCPLPFPAVDLSRSVCVCVSNLVPQGSTHCRQHSSLLNRLNKFNLICAVTAGGNRILVETFRDA